MSPALVRCSLGSCSLAVIRPLLKRSPSNLAALFAIAPAVVRYGITTSNQWDQERQRVQGAFLVTLRDLFFFLKGGRAPEGRMSTCPGMAVEEDPGGSYVYLPEFLCGVEDTGECTPTCTIPQRRLVP